MSKAKRPECWGTHLAAIPLRLALTVKIKHHSGGYDVFNKSFQLVGSGSTLKGALEVFFDHLLTDYYEFSLNPGPQGPDDRAFGLRLRSLFNSPASRERKLIDFHSEM
jgi:hypothetical protein